MTLTGKELIYKIGLKTNYWNFLEILLILLVKIPNKMPT